MRWLLLAGWSGGIGGGRMMRRRLLVARAVVAAVAPTSRPDALAAAIMAALVVREAAWSWFPAHLQGMASKARGAALVLVLLAAVWLLSSRSGWLMAAMAYGAWSALQTVICSIAYMVEPWTVPAGVGICSARIDFDLGALGLLAAAWFAVKASPVSSYRFNDHK